MTALDIYGYSERDLLARYEATNGPSREKIKTMAKKHGMAWVYKVNPYNQEPVLCVKPGDEVFNWLGDYVSPTLDYSFLKLLVDRLAAPYTGTKDDTGRILAIDGYAKAHGYPVLYWA